MDMVVEDSNVRSNSDTQGRRKRQRQRRKKKVPYSPVKGKQSVRAQAIRNKMFAHGQPVAPYNTTQFIMEDHNLQNIDIDAQLSKPRDSVAHPRTRDSSFSVESDDEFFYSSPEDEEEFLTKEFSLEYQDLHVERLNAMTKAEIIRDFLLLENKYEMEMGKQRTTSESAPDDPAALPELDAGEKLKMALLENRRLKVELDKVKRENKLLQEVRRDSESDSSVDSESDSSSSSSDINSASDSATSPGQDAGPDADTAAIPLDPEDETAERVEPQQNGDKLSDVAASMEEEKTESTATTNHSLQMDTMEQQTNSFDDSPSDRT